jgi:hypothetical protein
MYICTSCGYITDILKTYTEWHPYGDGHASETIADFYCPICRQELEQAEKCSICGEIKSLEDDVMYGGICDECLKDKAKDLDAVIECAKLDAEKQKVEVSSFLAYIFSPATVDEILWEYFNNVCKSETIGFLLKGIYQEKAEAWAKSDLSWFGDTLEEVMKNEQKGA